MRAALIACAVLLVQAAPATASMPGFAEDGARAERHHERQLQRGLSAAGIRSVSRELSRHPRVTGSAGLRTAVDASAGRLRSYGLDVSTPTYSVYASRPRDVGVTMTAPTVQRLPNREAGAAGEVVVGYNTYSAAGSASGEVVSAGRGLPADFAALARRGVDVRGRIVLLRYGGSYRGAKVRQAEVRGAAGVLLYSDPADSGAARGPVYPRGPWRPLDGIQRGTVEYLFRYPGDPLTPGAAALPGAPRLAPDAARNLPRIPVAPLSAAAARPLLDALRTPGGAAVRMDVDLAYEPTPVRDVLATIRGRTRPQELVIVGGHTDSWTYGAGDNASGWATIVELGRSLGRMLDRGWRPDRTIVLAGWDGEEQGLLGSTEWVEQHRRRLRRHAVAYLNLSQVGGTRFYASGVPALDHALLSVTRAVTDPRTGRSVHRAWRDVELGAPALGRLGSGSDYTAFLDHAGVPALDASFSAPAANGTYHTAYDTTENMERHLDPGYLGHLGSARVAGVLALRLANADVLPLRYSDYAAAVASYARALQPETPVRLARVRSAAERWRRAAARLEARAAASLARGQADRPQIARINTALMAQERALAAGPGLPGRRWFRHRVYAPGLASGYDVAYLPGLRDAVDGGADRRVRAQRDRLVDALRRAARLASRAVHR